MNASRSPSNPIGVASAGAGAAQASPAWLEPGFASDMDQTPFRRKRKRELSLSVTGLVPLPDVVPAWERMMIEQAVAEALDGPAPKEALDAHPR